VRKRVLGIAIFAAMGIAAPAAMADFPYPAPAPFKDLHTTGPQVPSDLSGNEQWMYSATAEAPGANPLTTVVNSTPSELNGVRGAHIVDPDATAQTAWQLTTGRPDVLISVLDSGIKWNDQGVMKNVRFKIHLNKGELPQPNHTGPALVAGTNCATFANAYDANGDGVFNLRDYACDSRVDLNDSRRVGPDNFLTPQDLLIAFSDGTDADGNGYVDDIAGWDFLDDDNDPFDDVQYGHGSGEIQDSTAEANNDQGGAGTCPNCMSIPLRVGDSFIADSNRFAAAVTYATDNGVSVVQEALGAMNNSGLSREAVDYAYKHGTTVIASAADEAAQHNNWPSSLPHVIMVNSVTKYDDSFGEQPPSYLKFNGCTNFYAKLTVSIPSVSCSSDATGRGSGIAGLIYSAALDAVDEHHLDPSDDCTRVDGTPCPITPNEVRQLMASGTIGGQSQADDVNFSQSPEPSCSTAPLPTCTDPFLGRGTEDVAHATLLPVVSPIVTSRRYPARAGHDEFYGYGRVNVYNAVNALLGGAAAKIPPSVEITSPDWYSQNSPDPSGKIEVDGDLDARPGVSYTCQVLVAPGHYPNNATVADGGDFAPVDSAYCDGSAVHAGGVPFSGKLADIDVADLEALFPISQFDQREPGPPPLQQTSAGRPNTAPYGFTIKVVATTTAAGPDQMTGEDLRAAYLHRDQDMLNGFPRQLPGHTDGESSPAFADLDGDNRNELIIGSSTGLVHAYRYDPASGAVSELPGWPVRGDVPGFISSHSSAPGYASGAVDHDDGGAIIAAVAVGDANHDGVPEVYAADLEGHVYGWDPDGQRVFSAQSNPAFSGKPLSPFVNVRQGPRARTQRGFLGSPVLADLDGNDGGKLEVIAAGMDRHVYAWNDDGSPVSGFPVLAVDHSKVAAVDSTTNAITWNDDGADQLNQGAIVDTPAVGDISGDSRPEIIVGTNEEYTVSNGTEGAFNASTDTQAALNLLSPVGILSFANGRIYAIKPDGDPDAPLSGADPFVAGWPAKIGIALSELLPVVGEGINGSPVIAPLSCAPPGGSGTTGPKVGTMPAAGPGYLLNGDGSSCLGNTGGAYRTLSDGSAGAGAGQIDRPVLPAVGLPAFGNLGGSQPSFVAPAAGIIRALDLAFNEYQTGGEDFIGAWNTSTGQLRPGFPSPVNDLSFLTGPAVGDVVADNSGEEIVAGTSSMDLTALGSQGVEASTAWPKLTTDWTIATPLIGSFGTLDTDPSAAKVVVNVTRSGWINAYAGDTQACAPASSPRFHHDNANSGDYRRDAVLPGRPTAAKVTGTALSFTAPGDDLMCGTATKYEIATSGDPITAANFDAAKPLGGAPTPVAPGGAQTYTIPANAKRYVAVRAVDDQGNVGRPAGVDLAGATGPGEPPPPTDPTGPTGPTGPGGPVPGPGTGACANPIDGTAGKDRLKGTADSDRIRGLAGADRLNAKGGDDCVSGQGGADKVSGGAGDDELKGGRGRDRIFGGAGSDTIHARRGGRDRINCGPGPDIVYITKKFDRTKNCEVVKKG
jgi:hypothetical protein